MARLTLVLAGVIAAGCGPGAGARPSVEPARIDNHKPARRADRGDPLALADGVTWRFTGTHTFWDDDRQLEVTEVIAVTTVVIGSRRVPTDDRGGLHGERVFRIRGWPADVLGGAGVETVVTIEDGIAYLGDPLAGEPWLQLPVAEGGGPGCEEGASTYCWRVEASGTGFDVIYRTTPDVTIYHLEPGRGVTRFEYHHHGTTNDVVLERVSD